MRAWQYLNALHNRYDGPIPQEEIARYEAMFRAEIAEEIARERRENAA